jgi:hypothetical protein
MAPSRWHPVRDRDNDNSPGIAQQPMTCTGGDAAASSARLLSAFASAGPWPLPSRTDPGLAWLASTSPDPATGRICVLTGNRAQPVAEYVVWFQSPVTV